ncbi:CSPG4 [Lepeophtheirus salmonis]|uniref:CSPG4 n=1 Tax=Lepeophtheirus salmonis TaxID=72036 RepID=A0A7R8D342_LEPSM|nr:CSPG4 [Lepeophtheirus salmonis]CAF3007363.1 CSPG4 [Lepeophtheirus salmonis]
MATPRAELSFLHSPGFLISVTGPPKYGGSQFDIVQEPKYGRLERLKNNGRWVSTKRFFSRHLEKGKLRYVHTRGGMGPGRPSRDSFTFSTAIGQDLDAADSKEKSIHVFKIEFISLQVRVIRNIPVKLLNVRETVLTDTHLLFQTYPETSEDSDLIYTIIDLPKYGTLLSNNDKNILKPGSNFTQVELLSGHLKYRLNNRAFKEVNDSFTFDVRHVSVEGSRSDIQVFEIYHVPGDSEVEITLERLEAPRHGQLDVLSANKLDVLRSNATFFTSEEIKDDRIVYKHDDSESRRDTFHFLVMSSSRSRHDFQYLAVFHIHIVLRNDQTPTRVVDKVFQVVDGGSKLLTERDLLFVDHDIDSRPQDIKYTHTAIPNGNLVSVDNPSKPVFQFSQKDLHDRKNYVQTSWSSLWKNYALVLNNTGLVVQERDAAFISSANLSVETNLNAFGPSIRFRITSPPSHGNLLKDDVMVSVFTEDDIVKRRVEYRNSPGTAYKDFFKFIVEVGNDEDREPFINEKEGTFEFHIYPESYWDPLEISSNKSLLVEESTSIAITRKDLRVSQGDLPSSDIIYKVITHPKYGYLELDPIYEEHMDSNVKVNSFTQQLIDEGHLHYIQSVSNQSDDSFRFEVTNGISTLRDLLFHFTIVPTNLYIETRNLVVTEGSKIPISPENLHILQKRGRLESLDARKDLVTLFSVEDLQKKNIWYIHDGSEGLTDTFSLVANLGSKTSKPTTMRVKVIPVNDKTPLIVNNTGLTIWAGAQNIPLTTTNLGAIDEDSVDEDVVFETSGLKCGKFSQADIKNGHVLFTHTGGQPTPMKIFVSDGLNVEKEESIPRSITYTVRKHPRLGRLLLDDKRDGTPKFFHNYDAVSNFTQDDLIAQRLQYVHEIPFNNLSASDSFSLEATTPFVSRKLNIIINVHISVSSSEGIEQLLGKENLMVKEGSRVQIRSRNLNMSGISEFIRTHIKGGSVNGINLRISSLPQHGNLHFHTGKVRKGDAFSQTDFDNGFLSYQHDHSDSRSDFIGISVYLLGDRSQVYGDGRGVTADVLLYSGSINVTIIPLNDREMTLLTDKPSIAVVQGQSKSITRDRLLVGDPDNTPLEILYEILNPPNSGMIDDIDKGNVIYSHDGSLKPVDFYFRVSDGHHKAIYRHFRVHIVPLEVHLSNKSSILLQQGTRTAYIKSENIGVTSNGKRSNTFFNVSRGPFGGKLYVNDEVVESFRQTHIDNEEVAYVQSDMSLSNDSFQVSIHNEGALPLRNVYFDIRVVPLVKVSKPFLVDLSSSQNGTQCILRDNLDATQLGGLTTSNPVYFIIRPPSSGKVMRVEQPPKTVPNPITEDVSTGVGNEKERTTILFIKCRQNRRRLKGPPSTPHTRAFHQTSTSSRSSSRMGNYDDDDGPGLLPIPPGHHHLHHTLQRDNSPRFVHCNGNNSGSNRILSLLSGTGNSCNKQHQDNDSWGESSRGSSPESSIPPGMPAFRVIPLAGTSSVVVPAESESSGTHVSDSTPGFTTLGSTGRRPNVEKKSILGMTKGVGRSWADQTINNNYGNIFANQRLLDDTTSLCFENLVAPTFHYDCASREEDFLRQNRILKHGQCHRRSSFSEGGGAGSNSFTNYVSQFANPASTDSMTLPKPLKGILKNRTNQSNTLMKGRVSPGLRDLVPFDTIPPCDDCVMKARCLGSYIGECSSNQECAMNSSTLRRSLGSLRSLSRNSNNEEKEVVETRAGLREEGIIEKRKSAKDVNRIELERIRVDGLGDVGRYGLCVVLFLSAAWSDDGNPFLAHFWNRGISSERKAPEIHLGYYTRVHGLQTLLEKASVTFGKPVQILNLGCGYDTLYWRLRSKNHPDTRISNFVEIDYPSITSLKLSAIKRSKELLSYLSEDEIRCSKTDLHASSGYHLLGTDLCGSLENLDSKLSSQCGIDYDAPTIFLAECVLIYLDPTKSLALLSWIADKFSRAVFVHHEQFNMNDRFGRVMLNSLRSRGTDLPGMEYCVSSQTQSNRFLKAGWTGCRTWTMNEVYAEFPPEEISRVEKLEHLDERELMSQLFEHYYSTIRNKDSHSFEIRNIKTSVGKQTHLVNDL